MFTTAVLTSLLLTFLSSTAHAVPLQPRAGASGPAISSNFMDPSVIEVDGVWYAFGGANGNPAGINVQVATSPDFSTWTVHSGYDALPQLGAWAANPGHVWSPDITQLDNGQFVLYYASATAQAPGQHCIGAATSSSIMGPYTALGSTFACDLAAGGAIDPDGFKDPVSGNHYVTYKVDGNSIGHGGACSNSNTPIVPTPILLQQVASDGITTVGNPVQLVTNEASDGPDVEAPTIYYSSASKTYFLLFSSGCYVDASYTVIVASATSVTGPYTRAGTPYLVTGSTAADVYIPGGVDVSADGSKVVFHGDLNLGWFQGNGARVRGMFAATAVTYANEAWVGNLA